MSDYEIQKGRVQLGSGALGVAPGRATTRKYRCGGLRKGQVSSQPHFLGSVTRHVPCGVPSGSFQ